MLTPNLISPNHVALSAPSDRDTTVFLASRREDFSIQKSKKIAAHFCLAHTKDSRRGCIYAVECVRAICANRRMCVARTSLSAENWRENLDLSVCVRDRFENSNWTPDREMHLVVWSLRLFSAECMVLVAFSLVASLSLVYTM
jgi:hypothetical protein